MVGMVTLYLNLQVGYPPAGLTTPIYAITPAPGEPVAFAFDGLLLPVRLDTSVLLQWQLWSARDVHRA